MQITNISVTREAQALSVVARADGTRVKFDNRNYVDFRLRGQSYHLNRIMNDWSTTMVFEFSTTFSSLGKEEQDMLVAAMLKLGIVTCKIGPEVIVLDVTPRVIVTEVHIEAPRPEPIRHASTWNRAQEFGVSGYRKEQQAKAQSPVEPVRVPTTKKGWLGLAALAVVTVGIAAIAASTSNE